jgi:L-threonylcarbamoyladenylate synthase
MEVRQVGDIEAQVAEAASCLQAGGIVLVPTDTVYGLAVLPGRDASIDRLFQMKGRPRTVNLPVMIAEEADASRLGAIISTSAAKLLASKYVPGPLTVALGVSASIAVPWLRGRIEVAVRIPDDQRLLAIIKAVGSLLVTSANLHTEETHESVPDILASLRGVPDLVIDDGFRDVVPSTLVNCRLVPAVVERVGVVPSEEIEAILQ